MATIREALAIAAEHHRAGRLEQAAQVCRQILLSSPQEAEALHRLGLIAYQQGNHPEAIRLIRRAIALQPRADFHFNLASVCSAAGQNAEAIDSLLESLRLEPGFADAHNNLGRLYKIAGRFDEAAACFRRAIELEPGHAGAHGNLGNTLAEQGRTEEAIACYRDALRLRPDHAETYNNLANALKGRGQRAEAITCYRRALAIKPDFALALSNLGAAWLELGKPNEAVICCRRAIELAPNLAGAHNNLGNAWLELDDPWAALSCYQRAVEFEPGRAEFQASLGRAWRSLGNLEQAADACRKALALKPDFPPAMNNLAAVLKDQGHTERALAMYRRVLDIQPQYVEAYSNYLCALRYDPQASPDLLRRESAEFDRRFAASLRKSWPGHGRRSAAEGRLRLGFVSPNFSWGPTGYFLIRALENLDRGQCEVVCYSDRLRADAMTARFQAAASGWRDVFGLTDEELADRIRGDEIDILFDLAGHGPRNRLLALARKPAPIQITWIDSVGTTGLAAIDYVLADRQQIPEQHESYYTERVLRLPESYVCYDPPADAPEVGPLPALRNGHVTFASFNNPAKIGPHAVELWARVLRRLPTARLLVKYRGIDDRARRQGYEELFSRFGIGPGRVEFEGGSPHAELLASYNRVDVALDPFYNGGLTTCEALWMGVPVVTCPGEIFPARHSLSHLTAVGLTETVARSPEHYVELAVSLAGDLARLKAIRASLRDRVAASPLCDGPRFARDLVALLRGVWIR